MLGHMTFNLNFTIKCFEIYSMITTLYKEVKDRSHSLAQLLFYLVFIEKRFIEI